MDPRLNALLAHALDRLGGPIIIAAEDIPRLASQLVVIEPLKVGRGIQARLMPDDPEVHLEYYARRAMAISQHGMDEPGVREEMRAAILGVGDAYMRLLDRQQRVAVRTPPPAQEEAPPPRRVLRADNDDAPDDDGSTEPAYGGPPQWIRDEWARAKSDLAGDKGSSEG